MNKFYKQIDNALASYEKGAPWHDKSMDWICDRVAWAWKWRKITEEEMTELTERAINILKR